MKKKNVMKGFKVTDKSMECRGFKYSIGKNYHQAGQIKLCENGFHFCPKLSNCFDYYYFDKNNRVFEIEARGRIAGDINDKMCASDIKLIRELTWDEVLRLCNSGNRNSGNRNSGNRNSGDWNSGDRNSGDRNSGDWNSGDCNSGNRNSGDRNSGNRNSGDWNSGNRNSGDWNSGNRNSGDCNSGNRNSGDRNSGDRNSGDWNSGDWNSGNRNSGDRNSGDWNSGDWNSGYFNTNSQNKIFIFNKVFDRDVLNKTEIPQFLYFELSTWISHDTATDEEKTKYKNEIETCGGFLKRIDFKTAFRISWDKAGESDRKKILKFPGFDAKLFEEISGIDVEKELKLK